MSSVWLKNRDGHSDLNCQKSEPRRRSRANSFRHVDVLLTENITDFPKHDVGSRCRVLRPDELFSELVEAYPIEFA